MAVMRAKPFFVAGLVDLKERFICELQKYGCVEIKNSADVVNCSNDLNYFNRRVLEIEAAVLGLRRFCKIKKSMFDFKKAVSFNELEKIENRSVGLLNKVDRVNFCCRQIEKNLEKISEMEQKKIELKFYLNFDFNLKNFESRFVDCLFVTCKRSFSELHLKKFFSNDAYFELVYADKLRTIAFLIFLKSSGEKVRKVLTKLKFSVVDFDFLEGLTFKQKFNFYVDEINKLVLQNNELKNELEQNVKLLHDFECLFDSFKLKLEQRKQLSKLKTTSSVFFVEGYLNSNFVSVFKKLSESFGLYCEIEEPDGCSPVDFKNCKVVSAVESVTKTYSMPSKFDIDPNPFMAFFYYAFFGIMFSDAAYGLIMSGFCAFFLVFKKLSLETKKSFRMFFWCGVSTVFWGIMFGSFFGDFIGVLSKKFLNLNFCLAPIFIDSLNEPMKLLLFSLLCGLIQVFVGVFLSFVTLLKCGNFKEAFFVKLSWLFCLFGLGIFSFCLFSNEPGLIYFNFFKSISLFFVFLGALMVLFLSGYAKKGFLKKIFSGFLNFYGATSYIGDILSYCRLMALSIATGVVANVVNMLSTMLCVNLFGFLAFLVVFIFGHLMNFGINALGAYVHTMRLQYVEFFSKFYEGGGRQFSPYGLNVTKYFEYEFDGAKIK